MPGIGISIASIMGYIGELIPALALGIPGGATSAMFLAALQLHGFRPGLSFFTTGGALVYTVFIGMILAQFVFAFLGIGFAKPFARVTKIPNPVLVVIILLLCFAGGYAIRKEMLDIVVCIVFGLIGYVLFKNKWPLHGTFAYMQGPWLFWDRDRPGSAAIFAGQTRADLMFCA
jgi:putative tricarboxylic transport membrane protein